MSPIMKNIPKRVHPISNPNAIGTIPSPINVQLSNFGRSAKT
jgi:hypothetical protein